MPLPLYVRLFRVCAGDRCNSRCTKIGLFEKLPLLTRLPRKFDIEIVLGRLDCVRFNELIEHLAVEANRPAQANEWDRPLPDAGVERGDGYSKVLAGFPHRHEALLPTVLDLGLTGHDNDLHAPCRPR